LTGAFVAGKIFPEAIAAQKTLLCERSIKMSITQITQERPTMTVKDAANLIGVSAPTMYDITERADFTALVKIGRKKLILRKRFLEWLDRQADLREE
jgi:excisionase family DNA binding protein